MLPTPLLSSWSSEDLCLCCNHQLCHHDHRYHWLLSSRHQHTQLQHYHFNRLNSGEVATELGCVLALKKIGRLTGGFSIGWIYLTQLEQKTNSLNEKKFFRASFWILSACLSADYLKHNIFSILHSSQKHDISPTNLHKSIFGWFLKAGRHQSHETKHDLL